MSYIRIPIRKGFGLAEVILAMFVLSIGLIGIMSTIAPNVTRTAETRNLIIADGLAQEGIGLIRNIRDNNMVVERTPAIGAFDDFRPGNNSCVIDYTFEYGSDSLTSSCGVGSSTWLAWNGSFYVTSNSPQKFSRKIVLDRQVSGGVTSYEVTSYVSWKANGLNGVSPSTCNRASKCAYAQTILSDWKYWAP